MLLSYLRKKAINFLVKGLLNGITSEDILDIKGQGTAYFKGKKLTDEVVEKIKSDAETISNSFLWKEILIKGIERAACENGLEKSSCFEDTFLAKGIIYAKDVIKTILYNIRTKL